MIGDFIRAASSRSRRSLVLGYSAEMEGLQFVQPGYIQARHEFAKGHRVVKREGVGGPKNVMRLLIQLTAGTRDCEVEFFGSGSTVRPDVLEVKEHARPMAICAAGDVVFGSIR